MADGGHVAGDAPLLSEELMAQLGGGQAAVMMLTKKKADKAKSGGGGGRGGGGVGRGGGGGAQIPVGADGTPRGQRRVGGGIGSDPCATARCSGADPTTPEASARQRVESHLLVLHFAHHILGLCAAA